MSKNACSIIDLSARRSAQMGINMKNSIVKPKQAFLLLGVFCIHILLLTGCESTSAPSGFSASMRRTPYDDTSEDYSDYDYYTDMEVPSHYLTAYENSARDAIREQLNIEVPLDAQISYSYYDPEDSMLSFTWTAGENPDMPDEYYSASYYNAVPEEGTGELYYVHANGNSISAITESIAVSALQSFSELLGQPVPKDYELLAEVSSYQGRRSVLLIWELSLDACSLSTYYTAGYDEVTSDYSDGLLTLLSIDTYDEQYPETGFYSEPEIASLQQAAERFVSAGPENEIDSAPYCKGYMEDETGPRGNVTFYFMPKDFRYESMLVTVNPEGQVISYVLSQSDMDNYL